MALGRFALGALSLAATMAACTLDENGLLVDAGAPQDATFDTTNDVSADVADETDGGDASTDADDGGGVTPATFAGLELWLKADQGVTVVAGHVIAWLDQSGQSDPSRNCGVGSFSGPVVIDAGFGPAVSFGVGQGLRSGPWTTALSDPTTIFVVAGKDPKSYLPAYLFDSVTATEHSVSVRSDGLLYEFAGAYGKPAPGVVSAPMTVIAIFNQSSSLLLRSTDLGDAGTSNPGVNAPGPGFTLGNYSGGGIAFNGYIVEFAAYSRVLTDSEIAALNTYAAGRYGVVIQ